MKRLALLLSIGITISSTDVTTITLPDNAQFQIIPSTPLVCPPTVQTPPAVSTGPYTLKASSGDCYQLPYVNPNGTLPATKWVGCPQ